MDTTKALSDKPSREFRQVLRDETASEVPAKTQTGTESQEQSVLCDPLRPKDTVQTWLAENSVAVSQSRDASATRVEPGAGRQLAQLIAGLKTRKPPPPTGHAAKSAQIKILHATEKGQLGIKTVLPEKSNGQNGLQTVSPETAKVIPAAKTQPGMEEKTDKTVKPNETALDTKSPTTKGSVRALTPEVSAAVKEAASANVSAATDASKPPAANTRKDLTFDAFVGGGKTPAASEKMVPVNAGMPSVQTMPVEKQSQPAAQHRPSAREDTVRTVMSPDGKESARTGNGFFNARGLQKLNVTGVQVSADQSKSRGRSAADNKSGQNFESMLPHNGPQIPIAQQSNGSAAGAKTASLPGQTPPGDVPADVGKQILESIHSSLPQQGGDRGITVHLNPPELGKVFIRFQEHNGELVGRLEVSQTQTRFEIEHALPQMVRNLAECGIQVRRLDVVLSDQGRSEQDPLGGQSPQNGGPYEHDSANQETRGKDPYPGEMAEWLPNDKSCRNVSDLQGALLTDSSINMLI
jgi:flagellar hook-length control protein FliK